MGCTTSSVASNSKKPKDMEKTKNGNNVEIPQPIPGFVAKAISTNENFQYDKIFINIFHHPSFNSFREEFIYNKEIFVVLDHSKKECLAFNILISTNFFSELQVNPIKRDKMMPRIIDFLNRQQTKVQLDVNSVRFPKISQGYIGHKIPNLHEFIVVVTLAEPKNLSNKLDESSASSPTSKSSIVTKASDSKRAPEPVSPNKLPQQSSDGGNDNLNDRSTTTSNHFQYSPPPPPHHHHDDDRSRTISAASARKMLITSAMNQKWSEFLRSNEEVIMSGLTARPNRLGVLELRELLLVRSKEYDENADDWIYGKRLIYINSNSLKFVGEIIWTNKNLPRYPIVKRKNKKYFDVIDAKNKKYRFYPEDRLTADDWVDGINGILPR